MAAWTRLRNLLQCLPTSNNSVQNLLFYGLRSFASSPVAKPARAAKSQETGDDSGEANVRKSRKSNKKMSRRPRFSKRHLKKMQPSPEEEYYASPKQMKTDLLNYLERRDMHQRSKVIDIPYFTSGSIMAVIKSDPHIKRGSTRFVGICIAKNNNRLGSTFILRNFIDGQGIEMMYETYSPLVQKIEVLKLERRRKSKLYYLRDKMPSEYTFKQSFKPVKHHNEKTVPIHKRKY